MLFDVPRNKTELEQRLDHEDRMFGADRPYPEVGAKCLVWFQTEYVEMEVSSLSKSGKSFSALSLRSFHGEGKVYALDIPVARFKPIA